MSLAAIGIVFGLAVGAAVPLAAAWLPEGWLPFPTHVGVFPEPLLLAGCFGLLTALCFAFLVELACAARIPAPPSAVPRGSIPSSERTRPHASVIAATAQVIAATLTGWLPSPPPTIGGSRYIFVPPPWRLLACSVSRPPP